MKEELEKYQIDYQTHVSLKDYTTLHIGGLTDIIVYPNSISQIKKCVLIAQQFNIPYEVIGKGSNILVKDEGYQGMIILLTDNFSQIELLNDNQMKVQSGATLKELNEFCLQNHLTGLEFSCGIPGTVGGAIYMNAGAYGGEMKDVVKEVTYLDEENSVQTLLINELNFSYRHSYFFDHQGIILEVIYQLSKGNPQKIQETMIDLMKRRYQKQPMNDYSAGSTFQRPKGHYASALIRQCGLQGVCIGDAQVSYKHTGFLINKGNASSHDFINLIKHVQKTVYVKTGYQLIPEVQILGNKEKDIL